MAFTAEELANIANAAMDYFMKGDALSQAIQEKPLLKAMKAAQKTFPGGKEDIRGNVKGDYTTSFQGYSGNDTVIYRNPANIRQFNFPWKELHAGIEVTLTELKKDGISVVDSMNGKSTSNHSDREMTAITNLFDDKLEDMAEGSAQSMDDIIHRDGTQSSKVFAGLQHVIAADPTTGVLGGIDRAANSWWRNRSLVGANKITHSTTNQTLTRTLRKEVRQLKRYGGKPSLIIAGSAFLEDLEAEVHEKGIMTDQGFTNRGATDIGMADISMRGVGTFQYDPTLDDLGLSDHCYFIDPRHLYLMVMEGEDMKQHNPARPADQYVLYRALTWTGGLINRKPNAHGVYQSA
jgi:hypothetical protein